MSDVEGAQQSRVMLGRGQDDGIKMTGRRRRGMQRRPI
jgi:hypothetical protein